MAAADNPSSGRAGDRPAGSVGSSKRRRMATVEEARALGHPLRVQILNLTHSTARTNKEIAARLGELPGTTLHHVKVLAEAGFLEALPARAGRRGAREVPYQATGKSWDVSFRDLGDERITVGAAITEAAYAEYSASDPRGRFAESQVSMRLTREDARELADRIHRLADEFRRTRQRPEGASVSLMWAFFEPREDEPE